MRAENMTDVAQDLVQRLNESRTDSFDPIEYAEDPFRNFEMVDGQPWMVLSPMKPEYFRMRPKDRPPQADLLLTMHVKQAAVGKEALMTKHLLFWDDLLVALASDEQVESVKHFRWHRYDPEVDRVELICQTSVGMKPSCAFGVLEQVRLFEYRGQIYRKESDLSALLLRMQHGEEVTERILHRFYPEVIVVPISEPSAC